MRRFACFFVVLTASLNVHCEHAGPLEPAGDGGLEPTFSSIQEHIFSQRCALSGCHTGSGAPLGLDLSAGNAYGNLVDVRSGERPDLFRVEPGNPDDSYLVMKLRGAPGIEGQQMPLTGEPLSQEQIGTISDWIRAGAQR